MAKIGNMRIGTHQLIELNNREERNRTEINDMLLDMMSLANRNSSFAQMRELHAKLRLFELWGGESSELDRLVDIMPLAEQPMRIASRARRDLLMIAYAVNTDSLNREELTQFACDIVTGTKPLIEPATDKQLSELLEYLHLDVFNGEEAAKFLARVVVVTAEHMQQNDTQPGGVDEEQQFLLTCIGLLGYRSSKQSFDAVAAVVDLCIQHGYYDKTVEQPTTRFESVLGHAFNALHRMFQDVRVWMWAEEHLPRWRYALLDGDATQKTTEHFGRLL
ncbi:MAG: hypothetical protein JWO07_483 [Candidatus Saccharibacteria bacterium]|nr:hypothetical protein [Candidatus Saccharibacteria bacterium]